MKKILKGILVVIVTSILLGILWLYHDPHSSDISLKDLNKFEKENIPSFTLEFKK